ncbi:PREDICTED: superoxide dismutase [Cu-Zn]-like [Cyphomyrmex costatus]|uniref:superoxide dismutase [Cu-Zn]-like n=1 Tax=Cyphomyrmex costatus TaxID=456900 RepID=UPI00085220EA|nr:PREDICTED: superoxide dismutase [Cu-Zn]-like [Cyphomyrmex costatus]
MSFDDYAVRVLQGEPIKGTVYFEQAEGSNTVKISGQISGLQKELYDLHVHEFGDNTNDLGNVEAGTDGVAKVKASLHVLLTVYRGLIIQLNGTHSVIGQTLVIHADPDDLGQGGHELSKTTGNAGARLACGVNQSILV